MDQGTESWKKFFVRLAGNTNGAHQQFVTKLRDVGHIEVNSLEESEYLLIFCPIVSRVGTDVSEALENAPDDKPTILVVMHHTFNPDHVVAESRRLVEKVNIATVDCLFYEDKLLRCNRNDIAWFEIQKCFGVPSSTINTLRGLRHIFQNNFDKKRWICCVVCGVVIAVIVLIGIIFGIKKIH